MKSLPFGKGKSVYTITPSWLIKKKKDFTGGVKHLERLGFRVMNPKFVTRLPSPAGKAAQIHAAFLNRKADLILAQRGGYSCIKVLPHLNFELIRKNPKVLAGFSDLTALLNPIFERTGLVTLHSPMVVSLSECSRFTVRSFLNALQGFPEKDLFARVPVTVYRSGISTGTLKGGNLITLTSLIMTKWEIKTDNCILFLEDVDEKLHKVDRYLTQWILAGKLARVKGIILGDFNKIRNEEVYRILSSQMSIKFPVVHCPYIGHVRNKITLPVGARVELNTFRKSLTLV